MLHHDPAARRAAPGSTGVRPELRSGSAGADEAPGRGTRKEDSMTNRSFATPCAALAALILLTACGEGGPRPEASYPDRRRGGDIVYSDQPRNTIWGEGKGLFALGSGGGRSGDPAQGGGGGVAVNTFLWRASLDTLSFMPLAQADPFGGVIITDWYSPPETPDERFKVNVFILTRDLRADGVRATVFKQRRNGTEWFDDPVDDGTRVQLENAILTRARELRIAQL